MKLNAIFPLLLVALLAGGCNSVDSGGASRPEAQVNAPMGEANDFAARLLEGMYAAEVRAAYGEPEKIETADLEGVPAEIWTYTRQRPAGEREVQTGFQEVPIVDSFTGAVRMVQEPVYAIETLYVTDILRIVLQGEQVRGWKVFTDARRNYTS